MQDFKAAELKVLCYWIKERDAVRHRKETRDLMKPWTEDPLLRDYRWCNVRRMDDKVSRWMLTDYYTPIEQLGSDRLTATAAALGRNINWPDSLTLVRDTMIEYAKTKHGPWVPYAIAHKLKKYKAAGNKVFTGAYIINGAGGGDKIDIVVGNADAVWKAMRKNTVEVLWDRTSMRECWARLCGFRGMGSFMAGQVVADLRHVVVGSWGDASDWAPLGPGSTRGMNRLLGRDLRAPMKQKEFDVLLPKLWDKVLRDKRAGEVFHERQCEAMDLQNCLCEFDKYRRLTLGTGTVRSKYPGAA